MYIYHATVAAPWPAVESVSWFPSIGKRVASTLRRFSADNFAARTPLACSQQRSFRAVLASGEENRRQDQHGGDHRDAPVAKVQNLRYISS
jgi:hypothetical protein